MSQLTESERTMLTAHLWGKHITPEASGLADQIIPIVEEILSARLAAVRDAFDSGDLECGRIGMPCTSVSLPDRWCRPCRIRSSLTSD